VATRRRTPGRSSSATRRRAQARKSGGLPIPRVSLGLSPAVVRSLVGVFLLGLGAVTLIALVLQGQGKLTDAWRDLSVPFFGTGRWLLPFVLLLAGWYVEWGPGREPGAPWGRTLLGIAMAYAGFLGLLQLIAIGDMTGGRIGRFLAGLLSPLLTVPGAFVILAVLFVAGLLIAFDRPLRALLAPATGLAKAAGTTLHDRTKGTPEAKSGRVPVGPGPAASSELPAAVVVAGADAARRGRGAKVAPGDSPGQTGVWGNGGAEVPYAMQTPGPTSATIAPLRSVDAGLAAAATAVAAPAVNGEEVTDASDSPEPREAKAWVIPPKELLDPAEVPTPLAGANQDAVHTWNEARITEKLASFGIEARVTSRNAGPVVTQYEVTPAPHVKVSRIEALSDDLAMALAARSIRIEAPIPGKSAVGIEIPNQEFNIVALRRILDEVDFAGSGSTLTFALGRDVAGKAMAVDLAKMPHLLIAGATGSGKSVMVNALITSLLCNATPDDTRMILMDLKRVELAGYNGLPHLLVPVITEPERAKAALKWAVGEMENRYRRFAGATARNIRSFNESRVDPADRLPYIVIVIDELADLMMREGKNVEDPIVRLAQKARATGIHMVLATQRPSVNVVTGLIKANFPSRIAFAMASQIDSRTILDAPGAEDLIGRGDMLYQPSDLPRPMRLQGVFVSDPEIGRVTQHWRDQIDDPRYDLAIVTSDEESTGSVDDLADEDADRLLPDAVGVIREYDRASASLLQRRLKIGYARAARIIDQLEARGYVGAFDGSNARVVLRRDDGAASDVDEDEG
jgi:S-DNA-T family DNA segregation ATPase FtsK/SpoIIIE